jgi:hypothetical protein
LAQDRYQRRGLVNMADERTILFNKMPVIWVVEQSGFSGTIQL